MRRRILRTSALLLSSIGSFAPQGAVKAEAPGKYSKKLRESVLRAARFGVSTIASDAGDPPPPSPDRYPWKKQIVTTTFWVGEAPTKNNPVPNHVSSWDADWAKNYGGTDDPDPDQRAELHAGEIRAAAKSLLRGAALQRPDDEGPQARGGAGHSVVSKTVYRGSDKSVCKGRWIAIKFKDRVCYAQWEDCGPFRTDHWQYVFGNERPKPNLNKGAGLDVSPAVRDFLGMNDTDVTDWKFVDFDEVPTGPWATHGNNNTFVINKRLGQRSASPCAGRAVEEIRNRKPAAPIPFPCAAVLRTRRGALLRAEAGLDAAGDLSFFAQAAGDFLDRRIASRRRGRPPGRGWCRVRRRWIAAFRKRHPPVPGPALRSTASPFRSL